jgi:HlyD family secretion protein
MIMRGRIGLLILVLAIAAALTYGFMPKSIPVEVVEAKKASLEITVDEEGKTRVRERYVVSAPVAGYARRIDLKVGDPVHKDQVVAVLEPARAASLDPRSRAQAIAQLAAAQSAQAAAVQTVRAAAAQERLAQQEFDRNRTLGQSHFVSQSAIDQARTALQAAQANRESAEQSAKVAAYNTEAARTATVQASALDTGKATESIKVISPVDGSVLSVPHESEGAVQAGQALLEVGNPGSLEIVVEVLSTAAVKIAPGSMVRIERWGGDKPLEARVREIEPAGFTKVSALGVEEQRVRVVCDLTSPSEQWRRLGDGYRVEASFIIWSAANALQVPTDALFRYKDGWAVYVMDAERAKLRPLQAGQRNGLQAQVLSGLKAGEKIISRPGDQIQDGSRVKSREPE